MSKLDEMRRGAGANVGESMGAGRVPGQAMHGALPSGVPARLQGVKKSTDAAEIPVAKIVRDPNQPREDFESEEAVTALARLTESVRARGVLQPIRVRWDQGQGMYVVIAGERRLRAARAAGRVAVPCVIQDGPIDPGDLLAIQLLENCLREDLKPVEEARAFKALMDQHGWTATRVGQELGIDQSSVSRALKLLELPAPVRELVEQGELPAATAYEVSKLDDPDAQREVVGQIVAEGLSRDQAAERVREVVVRSSKARSKGRGAKANPRPPKPRTFARLRAGKVVVEPKTPGREGILAALDEARGIVAAEIEAKQGRGEAAA